MKIGDKVRYFNYRDTATLFGEVVYVGTGSKYADVSWINGERYATFMSSLKAISEEEYLQCLLET